MSVAKLLLVLLLLVGSRPTATATARVAGPAAPAISRIDPTFWWVGMKNPKLQLLVHGPGRATSQVTLARYPGVTLDGFQRLESPNYLVVNFTISPSAQPGKLQLEFQGQQKVPYAYELRARTTPGDKAKGQGISSADFIYLLVPDRFANGDPTNDVVKGNRAPALARDSMYARHGGDPRGIEQHFPTAS